MSARGHHGLLMQEDGGDPYAPFRVSILNLDTDLTDPKRPWTAGGDAAVVGGRLELDGAGDYIETASSPGFNIGSLPFCFEAYITLDTSPSAECAAMCRWGPGAYDWFLGFNSARRPVLYYYTPAGTPNFLTGATSITLGVEYHVAWYKNASGTYIALNGSPEAITGVGTIRSLTQVIRIGAQADNLSFMDGRIRGARMTVGSAGGYGSGSFTPPSLPLPT